MEHSGRQRNENKIPVNENNDKQSTNKTIKRKIHDQMNNLLIDRLSKQLDLFVCCQLRCLTARKDAEKGSRSRSVWCRECKM